MPEILNTSDKARAKLGASERPVTDLRILFVAEYPHELDTLRTELEGLGYKLEIRTVSSFDDFKTAISEHFANMILVDLNLPGLVGLRALRFLKSSKTNIPFIVITDEGGNGHGYVSVNDVNRLAELINGVVLDELGGGPGTDPGTGTFPPSELGKIFSDMESDVGSGFAVVETTKSRLLYASEAFARTTGFSIQELLAMDSISELVVEAERESFETALDKATHNETRKHTFDVRIVRKDRATVDLRIVSRYFDWNGRKDIAIFARRDLGEPREMAGSSRMKDSSTSEKFWTAAENLPTFAVFDVDADGKVRSWNLGAEQFTGFQEKEIMSTEFVRLLPEVETGERLDSFFSGTESSENLELESWLRRKDGTKLRAMVSLTGSLDAAGNFAGYSAFLRRLHYDGIPQEWIKGREAQLHSLASHLQETREEEKTLVARRLHDEFGQMLTAVRMELAVLAKMISKTVSEPHGRGSILEKISSVSGILEGAIKSARDLINELRPAVLDELGLLTAIRWQVMEFENKTGINCHITSTHHGETFDPAVSTAAFRILQEALDNVMRHSSATEAFISLDVIEPNVVLEVTDNGKGIDSDKLKHPDSIGIIGMRERALALGGKLDVWSKPGNGTTLIVSFPCLIKQSS